MGTGVLLEKIILRKREKATRERKKRKGFVSITARKNVPYFLITYQKWERPYQKVNAIYQKWGFASNRIPIISFLYFLLNLVPLSTITSLEL